MKNLYIESTEFTPKIIFDLKKKVFELSGISRPEDVIAFYESIIYKADSFVNHVLKSENDFSNFSFTLKFDLTYMNSASSKYILHLLDHFKKIFNKGAKITVDWYYDDVDDQLYEDGEDLSDVIRIPFNLIPRN